MRQMDCTGNLRAAGTDGGFACSCQPTESDCIFAENVGTGHNFYQERGKIKTEKIWNGYLYAKKAKTTILRILLKTGLILYFNFQNFRNFTLFCLYESHTVS